MSMSALLPLLSKNPRSKVPAPGVVTPADVEPKINPLDPASGLNVGTTGARGIGAPGTPTAPVRSNAGIQNAGSTPPAGQQMIKGSLLGMREDGSSAPGFTGGTPGNQADANGKPLSPEEAYRNRYGKDLLVQSYKGTNKEKLAQAGAAGLASGPRADLAAKENLHALQLAADARKANKNKRGKASTYLVPAGGGSSLLSSAFRPTLL